MHNLRRPRSFVAVASFAAIASLASGCGLLEDRVRGGELASPDVEETALQPTGW